MNSKVNVRDGDCRDKAQIELEETDPIPNSLGGRVI
jgi:hypothetical protein